jgi:tetratricopeptide (TPR) repeat protein
VFERLAAASAELPAVLADALSGAGVFNYRRADRELAARQLETARALYVELGNDDEAARCLAELGAIAVDDDNLSRASELFTEAAAAFGRVGNDYRFAVALANLAAIEVQRGNFEAAAGYSTRAIALQRSLGDVGGLGVSLANLGRAQLKEGELEAARVSLREAFEVALRIDYKMLIAYLLGSAGDFAAAQHDQEEAVRLIGAGAALFAAIGMPVPPEELVEHERTLGPLTAALGAEQTTLLFRQGAALPVEAAIETARKLF